MDKAKRAVWMDACEIMTSALFDEFRLVANIIAHISIHSATEARQGPAITYFRAPTVSASTMAVSTRCWLVARPTLAMAS